MTKEFKAVSIRVPAELHAQVTARCRSERRSFNEAVLNQLQSWIDGPAETVPAAVSMTFKADFSALEERIMARLDSMQRERDLVNITEMRLNTDGMSVAALEEFKGQVASMTGRINLDPLGRMAFQRPTVAMTIEEDSKRFPWGGSHSPGPSFAPNSGRYDKEKPVGDIYRGTAEAIIKQLSDADLKRQLEYWAGCTCVKEIPALATDKELVEYYEANCKTCGRNYKHLETGEQE